jgi:hypothetical protein
MNNDTAPAIDTTRADAFAATYPVRPIPAVGPVDTTPIVTTPAALGERMISVAELFGDPRLQERHPPANLLAFPSILPCISRYRFRPGRVAIVCDTGWARG